MDNEYYGKLLENTGEPAQNRIMIGIPMTGLLRSEWVLARYGQVIPCNWSVSDCIHWLDQTSPLKYAVADARNIICYRAIMDNFEWLLFIDHDVVLPPTFLLKMNDYMLKKEVPIVGGLYFTRSAPSEPLIYRGRGNSYYTDWKFGDKVWVDGMGLGCHIIHVSILKEIAKISPMYKLANMNIWKIFETPARAWFDPEKLGWQTETGTEDLFFYHKLIDNDILKKAGWKNIGEGEFQFLCDTSLFCKHIEWNGVQYPARQEELAFMDK